jgi:23S rRNA (adenine2503-C2)-methyltransferase
MKLDGTVLHGTPAALRQVGRPFVRRHGRDSAGWALDLLGPPARRCTPPPLRVLATGRVACRARALHRDAARGGVFAPEAHGVRRKSLLRLVDDRTIESVHLPMGHGRSSLCLSTQVGCARAWTFCETGRMGLSRNLTAGEIVALVTVATRQRGRSDNRVFMGMGKPLDNLGGLVDALAVLTDRAGFAYAQDKLTVGTVGHVPGIARLREPGWKRLGLALSRNAADDGNRATITPQSARYPLREIQQALVAFRQRANLALGRHWRLLPRVNEVDEDVRGIAVVAAPLGRCFVHVVPYNPGTAPIARAPSADEVRDVMAACAQLGAPVRAGP